MSQTQQENNNHNVQPISSRPSYSINGILGINGGGGGGGNSDQQVENQSGGGNSNNNKRKFKGELNF